VSPTRQWISGGRALTVPAVAGGTVTTAVVPLAAAHTTVSNGHCWGGDYVAFFSDERSNTSSHLVVKLVPSDSDSHPGG
jgi:hypothetical protein